MYNSKNTNSPEFNARSIISKYNLESKIGPYFHEILEYNKKINIVSRETSRDDLLTIAADSLIPFEFILPPSGKIFDIGSGAGFPSIVVLLAFPDLHGFLIERTKKKTAFLRKIIDLLKLKAEIMDINFVEIEFQITSLHFDIGLMKLVRPNMKLLKNAFDLLIPSGRFVYYSDFDETSINMPSNVEIKKYKYFLDKSNRIRTITVFNKIF